MTTELGPGRNILAGVFPLLTHAMFTRMTFAGASSLLGGVVSDSEHHYLLNLVTRKPQATILTLVPWVLVRYGPEIRARSKFASVRYIFSLFRQIDADLIL